MPLPGDADSLGALVLTALEGTDPSESDLDRVASTAGVVLFARNIVSAEQCRALLDRVRAAFARRGPLPPIIAIDQEGGPVARLDGIGMRYPSAMALGAARDADLIERVHRAIGDECVALGFTLDLAPVADVNIDPANPVIGIRSFGDDPTAVAEAVGAAVKGLHAGGVGAVAKHFPGHGATSTDSHDGLPSSDMDRRRLDRVELAPFRAAIAANVDAVMTAHGAFPKIDPSGSPATLSKILLTDILRGDLGFHGVICSDSLEMGAIAKRMQIADAAVAAAAAGNDLLLCTRSIDEAEAAARAVAAASKDGRLAPSALEASRARVNALRSRAISNARRSAGSEDRRALAREAFARSIAVVRNPGALLPLNPADDARIFVVQFVERPEDVKSGGRIATDFGRALAERFPCTQEQVRSLDPAGHEFKQLLMASSAADVIVAVTRDAVRHPLQARALGDLALAGKPLFVVAARSPYDAAIAPADSAVLATSGDAPEALDAAADVLLGRRQSTATLPVSLPAIGALAQT